MRAACVPISATISARGEDGLTPRMQRHVEGCHQCQGELADHRMVARGLSDLRNVTYSAPAEIMPRVMADIGPWAVPDLERRRDRRIPVAAANRCSPCQLAWTCEVSQASAGP